MGTFRDPKAQKYRWNIQFYRYNVYDLLKYCEKNT